MRITKSLHWYRIKKLIPENLYDRLLIVYFGIYRIFYIGNTHGCPVCSAKLRKFDNGLCPSCGSSNRHRSVVLFIEKRTDLYNNQKKLLHFAPEFGLNKMFSKKPGLEYYSADIDSPRAKYRIDITNIPYKDDYFDAIISSHVLEHVEKDTLAMKELCRVQKTSGWSIHLVPINKDYKITYSDPTVNTPELRQKIYGHHDHKRIYGADYIDRLRNAGFKVQVIEVKDFLSPEESDYYSISPNLRIFFCKK